MLHLEGRATPVLYIGRTVPKGYIRKYRPLEQLATNLVTCITESYPVSKKWDLLLRSKCKI